MVIYYRFAERNLQSNAGCCSAGWRLERITLSLICFLTINGWNKRDNVPRMKPSSSCARMNGMFSIPFAALPFANELLIHKQQLFKATAWISTDCCAENRDNDAPLHTREASLDGDIVIIMFEGNVFMTCIVYSQSFALNKFICKN